MPGTTRTTRRTAPGVPVTLRTYPDRAVLLDDRDVPVLEVVVPPPAPPSTEKTLSARAVLPLPDPLASAVVAISLDLLQQTAASARTTQQRLSFSFAALNWMLIATFVVGLGAFAAALWKGLRGDDVATTAVFAGLSATAFVTTFITRTTDGVSDAGPRSAWIQAIVSTYWTKLAYFSDTGTAARDLESAQEAFDASIERFLAATHRQRQTASGGTGTGDGDGTLGGTGDGAGDGSGTGTTDGADPGAQGAAGGATPDRLASPGPPPSAATTQAGPARGTRSTTSRRKANGRAPSPPQDGASAPAAPGTT